MTIPATVGITGVSGFIGSHLAERLLAEGRTVVGIDDFSHGLANNMDTFRDHPNFTFVELDCRDALQVRRRSPTAMRSSISPRRRSRASAAR